MKDMEINKDGVDRSSDVATEQFNGSVHFEDPENSLRAQAYNWINNWFKSKDDGAYYPDREQKAGTLNLELTHNSIAILAPRIATYTPEKPGLRPIQKLKDQMIDEFEHAYKMPHRVMAIAPEPCMKLGINPGDFIYIKPEMFAFQRTGQGFFINAEREGYNTCKVVVFESYLVVGKVKDPAKFDAMKEYYTGLTIGITE